MELPLIPVEQFLADRPEHAENDENALMAARIDHEHAEREALEQQRQTLLKKKNGLIADNKKRKDELTNLDKELERFIDVSEHISSLTAIPCRTNIHLLGTDIMMNKQLAPE